MTKDSTEWFDFLFGDWKKKKTNVAFLMDNEKPTMESFFSFCYFINDTLYCFSRDGLSCSMADTFQFLDRIHWNQSFKKKVSSLNIYPCMSAMNFSNTNGIGILSRWSSTFSFSCRHRIELKTNVMFSFVLNSISNRKSKAMMNEDFEC